jgi:hypothetical protein
VASVQSPVKLGAAIVIAALAIWKLVVPGVWTLAVAETVDDEVDASARRTRSITGRVTEVHAVEQDRYVQGRKRGREVAYRVHAEVQVPGEAGPRRTSEGSVMLTSRAIKATGEQPENAPKRGDPVTLYYDPEERGDLSFYAPVAGGASIGWMSLVFLIPGVIALAVAGFLARGAFRAPR